MEEGKKPIFMSCVPIFAVYKTMPFHPQNYTRYVTGKLRQEIGKLTLSSLKGHEIKKK